MKYYFIGLPMATIYNTYCGNKRYQYDKGTILEKHLNQIDRSLFKSTPEVFSEYIAEDYQHLRKKIAEQITQESVLYPVRITQYLTLTGMDTIGYKWYQKDIQEISNKVKAIPTLTATPTNAEQK